VSLLFANLFVRLICNVLAPLCYVLKLCTFIAVIFLLDLELLFNVALHVYDYKYCCDFCGYYLSNLHITVH